jgi:transposase-like protein
MLQNFKSIFDLVQAFPTEQDCINHLEILRWNGTPVSPFDASSIVYKCSNNRYKCKNTGKYFNVKVGTIFENTNIKLQKWFMALYIFSSHKKGISSHQLAKDISVTQKSAWFMLHRLRYAFDHPTLKGSLSNCVEIDETYMGADEKNKHTSKKTEGAQGRSTKTKKPVLGMKERDGNIVAKVVDDTKSNTIIPIIEQTIIAGSEVYTDEYNAYNSLSRNYTHLRVNHGAKEYVNQMAHTNGLENFWSHLKRGVDGIYHWVSKPHLQSYVDEFVLRFNTRDLSTSNRFNLVLSNAAGRLKYNQLKNR